MSVKHVLLVALVLVNLLLMTAVVLEFSGPRPAQAQVAGGGFAYAVVTGRTVQGPEEVLWVLDLKTRVLSMLRLPQQAGAKVMLLLDSRDMAKDLRGEK